VLHTKVLEYPKAEYMIRYDRAQSWFMYIEAALGSSSSLEEVNGHRSAVHDSRTQGRSFGKCQIDISWLSELS
jgi:hypothetical protein